MIRTVEAPWPAPELTEAERASGLLWPAPELHDGHDVEELAQDSAPTYVPENRASRREALSRMADLPWHGPIPNVGRSIRQIRDAAAGRTAQRHPHRTPVRVDVVPVIHARARRGAWAARCAGARLAAVIRTHYTYVPATAVDGARSITAPTIATAAADGAEQGPSVESLRDVEHHITPTRGAPPGPALSLGPLRQ